MTRIERLPDDVVNRIAAGEVVVRPANAIKELIENCLDAGSNEIIITLKDGGLTLLQVQDNGKGIYKDDMDIVCERYTTSKLKEFEDLQNMKTYGFRGEALSSISTVSKVTITTKPKDQKCAYQGKYIDGKPISIKASAGRDGTCITAEDLFYNCQSRKQSFRNHSDETNRVADVITRYAVHRPDVSFAMRRGGTGTDFRTSGNGNMEETIALLLGKDCSQELTYIDHSSVRLHYTIKGCFSKPLSAVTSKSVQAKKNRQKSFFIFINGRIVSCATLKHSMDNLMAENRVICALVLLSLDIDPQLVDVNVHPTKENVLFLEEDAIIEDIRDYVKSLLVTIIEGESTAKNNGASNNLKQQLLTSTQISRIPINKNTNNQKNSSFIQKKRADHMLVRSDTHVRRLDEFLVSKNFIPSNIQLVIEKGSQDNVRIEKTKNGSRRIFELNSLDNLRRNICLSTAMSLRDFFKSYSYIGCISPEEVMIQYTTSMYLIDLKAISFEFFYQSVLFSFGNLGSYKLGKEGINIHKLYRTIDQSVDSQANALLAVNLLSTHMDMLNDYFSIKFELRNSESDEKELYLICIPSIVSRFIPQLEGLSRFIQQLVMEVNWDEEELCFDSIAKCIAELFVIKKEYCKDKYLSDVMNTYEWEACIRDILLPRLASRILPTESFKINRNIQSLATLHQLYKVFERC